MLTALETADGETILPLALLKARVRVLSSDEDTDIARMRAQAIDHVERYSGIALQKRAFRWTDKQFSRSMLLPIGPVDEVTGITYAGPNGDVEMTTADWYVGDGTVEPARGSRWPYSTGQAGSVRIEFTAGLDDAETQAPMLIAAVEVGVAALYENRESPDWLASDACAEAYRMPGL